MGMRKSKESERERQSKEKEKKEQKPVKKEVKRKVIEGIRGIIRVAEVDLAGERKVRNALLGIKGIGHSLSKAIPLAAGLNPELMIGSLSDEQLEKLEDVIKNPQKYGIPVHMLNRKKDTVTGESRHMVSSELSNVIRSDIDFMKKIRSYKGIRHELGLPVRGQRTRSSFRTGMIVGVTKAKIKPGAAPAATPGTPAAPGAAPAAGAQPAKTGTQPAKPGAPAAAAPAKTEAKAEKKEEKGGKK